MMLLKTLNLVNQTPIKINITEAETETQTTKKEIAIIGMSGTIGSCKDLDSFWQCIVQGKDQIHKLSEGRISDIQGMLRSREEAETDKFYEAAFLDEIDKFDYEFYGMSPKEASLINPHQRLFLENVWSTLEDAGYGGGQLAGSNTGVFLGLMSDAGDEYRDYALKENPSMSGITSVGNMNSITAGRVSYLYDLRGPSMTIDTACSSGLTAVYLACQSIRTGNCEQAIAGSVKLDLAPIDRGDTDIDIISSDRKTRTFDDAADGTGSGEGVCSILLKSYQKAVEDGDHIYAIIKGAALNQDGSSIGLTAPNSIAQEEVIIQAWKDAGVAPETISYIEAHGTGTKLGDPVEISAINRAFSKYTNQLQFCAIGSVKSNTGHLNQASGLVSLIKVVLAMKNHVIPPTNHFKRPNRKINLIDSPVFVNDRCLNWDATNYPRRAGVSGFGLSGTNCHLIVEEAPERRVRNNLPKEEFYLIVLSAQYEKGIRILVNNYIQLVCQQPKIDLMNMCVTANIGRGHYTYRVAILFKDHLDLRWKLHRIAAQKSLEQMTIEGVYYGSTTRNQCEMGESSDPLNIELENINGNEAFSWQLLEKTALAYTQGSNVNWIKLYRGKKYQKMSLPMYPFQRNRCWVERTKVEKHPFLDCCVTDSIFGTIYKTMFSPSKHWILKEHKVNDYYTIPGVSYIEMIGELGRQCYGGGKFQIKDLVFLHPLIVGDHENKEVHTIIQKKDACFEFSIASKQQEHWVKHVEGKYYSFPKEALSNLEILGIKEKCIESKAVQYQYGENENIYLGPRWNVIESIQFGEGEALTRLKLSDAYQQDLEEFYLHPSLLDCAMNATIQMVGAGLYLPWGYKNIKVYSGLPKEFYSYVRRTDHGGDHAEAATFDITVADLNGSVLIDVTGYMVKKVNDPQKEFEKLAPKQESFYQIGWIKKDLTQHKTTEKQGTVLALMDESEECNRLISKLRTRGNSIVEIRIGETYEKINENTYKVASNEASYRKLFDDLKVADISSILHMLHMNRHEIHSKQQFEESKSTGVMSLYYLTRASLFRQIKQEIDIVLIASQVNEVTKQESELIPEAAALFGLGKVVRQECTKLKCRGIDIDFNTGTDEILKELEYGRESLVAYRNGQRYMQELQLLDIKNIPERNIAIRDEGVYLITGGMGGLGLEFAKYISKKRKVNLALLNRSKLPDRNRWKEIIKQNEDIKLIKKLEAIQEMEAASAKVNCYSVDVSEEEQLREVLEELRKKYGKINGIFHAAGVAGDGLLINKDEYTFQRVLKPKMDGTWLISQLTKQDPLDFVILFSSIGTLFGGMGQGDYTAANTYLDSYAAYENRKGRTVLCVNWPAWKETGMAVEYGKDQDGMFQSLSTKDAIQGFERVLGKDIHNVIISKMNQEYSMEEYPVLLQKDLQIGRKEKIQEDIRVYHHKTWNDENEKEPYDTIKHKLVAVWKNVLGFNYIDSKSNFIQLGGNSVLAVSLYRELEQEFPDLLDVSDIYTYPTIGQMAEYLYDQTGEGTQKKIIQEEEELDILLEKLSSGHITQEQIDELL